MMRKCHLNTCPVGVATQDPELRARFAGKPEHVIRYLFFVAEERAASWRRSASARVDEMVGRVDCIVPRAAEADAAGARLSQDAPHRLRRAALSPQGGGDARRCTASRRRITTCAASLDHRIIAEAKAGARDAARASQIATDIRNRDRAFGAMLSRRDRPALRPRRACPTTPSSSARAASAGQSFGAFAVARA